MGSFCGRRQSVVGRRCGSSDTDRTEKFYEWSDCIKQLYSRDCRKEPGNFMATVYASKYRNSRKRYDDCGRSIWIACRDDYVLDSKIWKDVDSHNDSRSSCRNRGTDGKPCGNRGNGTDCMRSVGNDFCPYLWTWKKSGIWRTF